MERFDVIVIGTGQGGVPFAVRAGGTGRRTLIIERDVLGGTCVNRGCTPTKTMIASATAAQRARTAGRLGVSVERVEVDLGAIVARKDGIVRQWRDGVEQRLRNADGVTLWRGQARFTGRNRIDIDGRSCTAGTILINTGARPAVPDIAGLRDSAYLDSTSILDLRTVPEHLVVIGGGYIGCELGQMFRRFGAAVTIVARGPHLLGREDDDVTAVLEETFRAEGIVLHMEAEVSRVERNGDAVTIALDNGTTITGSHLLVATGRAPNTDALDCAAAGIDTDERGFIHVDDGYATTARDVYAIGDVTGGPQFTHSSWDDHRILFDRLFNGRTDRGRHDRTIPYTVFTDPPLARVGLSERAARDRGIDCLAGSMPFGHIARAIEVDQTRGIVKVLVDPGTDRILGAAIVGIEAGELIHIFTVMLEAGASARALVDMEVVHPTLAEGIQSVLMSIDRYSPAGRDEH